MVAWVFLGFCSDGSVCVALCVEPVLREKERKKKTIGKPRKTKVSVRKKNNKERLKNNILIKIEVWDVEEL